MGFESPASFLWAVLAAVVAALYLWNFARQRHEVATFPLWQRALARRPAWFVLRFWLSLLVQIVIVMLIVVALAEPFWTQIAANRRSLVMVLDVSASMSATDVSPSRFESMRSEARRMIDNLQRGEQMAILSAGTTIRPLCRLGAPREALVAAVDALQPTDGETRIAEAVAIAQDLLHGQRNSRVVVLTDGGFPEAAAIRQQEGVCVVLIGGAASNGAITHLAARQQTNDASRLDVSVEVANTGTTPIQTALQIGLADADPERVEIQLGAGQSSRHALSVPATEPVLLQARLDADDHLAADNLAAVRVVGRAPTRVQLVAAPSDVATALRTALEAMTQIELDIAEQLPAEFDAATVYVVHRQVPSQIPPVRMILLDPQGGSDLWEFDRTIEGPQCAIARIDSDSSLLSEVDLQSVVFERATPMKFREPIATVATAASGDSVYTELDRAEGSILVFHAALDREHSDFVLRQDFAWLVQNAVSWLADGERRRLRAGSPPVGRAGRVLTAESLQSLAGVTTDDVVQLNEGQSLRWTGEAGETTVKSLAVPLVALDRVGLWELTAGDSAADRRLASGGITLIPANLLDAGESELTRPEGLTSDELPLAEPAADQPLWMLLAGIALVLLALEWCLYHRRVVV
ncbi:MAG: VWA domain-containing protein [Pirellulaceae bacterium]|nr:VWA domain-containing protein [Pirellulaceae bacterium]